MNQRKIEREKGKRLNWTKLVGVSTEKKETREFSLRFEVIEFPREWQENVKKEEKKKLKQGKFKSMEKVIRA